MKLGDCPIHPLIGVPCWHVVWESGDEEYDRYHIGATCYMSEAEYLAAVAEHEQANFGDGPGSPRARAK